MAKEIFVDGLHAFMKGEIKDAGIEVWDRLDNTTDLSTATAVMTIYKASDDTSQLASGACTITGTTRIKVKREWDTRAAGNNPDEGDYKLLWEVTFNGKVQYFQTRARILGKPSPAQ